MIPAARLNVVTRPFSTTLNALALAQRGDPGPSSRKSAELLVRSSIRSGQESTTLNGRDALDDLLDASAPPPPQQFPFSDVRSLPSRYRTPHLDERSAPSGPRSPLGRSPQNRTAGSRNRPGIGRNAPRQRFDPTSQNFYIPRPPLPSAADKLLPNPYDTSRQLREWIRAHPLPINATSLQEAIGIVTNAEKGAVNAVVWNALLGLAGRQGGLEKMWKLYNDVSWAQGDSQRHRPIVLG